MTKFCDKNHTVHWRKDNVVVNNFLNISLELNSKNFLYDCDDWQNKFFAFKKIVVHKIKYL